MTLPIAISIPHAGLGVPPEAAPYCRLTREEIVADGDEGAAEIYDLKEEVAEFITTDIARAIVDLNRPIDDRRADGVVKTHTIWKERVYSGPLPGSVIKTLLENYYHPYHARLSALATCGLLFAVDCHSMAEMGPPIGPDPGEQRPEVCLGDLCGRSFPPPWMSILHEEFLSAFPGFHVTINQPFAGGHITQAHCREMPWLQIEISRARFLPRRDISNRVLQALANTCAKL